MLTYGILKTHAARYPLMQPTDAVKLAYQAAFGGGHLIRDAASCRRYLDTEYVSVRQDANAPLCAAVCPGIPRHRAAVVRINLCSLDAHGITTETLCDAFVRSAEAVLAQQDNRTAFCDSLSLLRRAADEGTFGFDRAMLDSYLDEYLTIPGLPPVSHSEAYRMAYAPHYRIVCPCFLPEASYSLYELYT